MLPQAALLVPFLFSSPFASAQATNATCDSSFNWSFNTLKQSPCVMASYLRAACKGNHNIQSLPEGYSYNGPGNPASSEPCWCSSVTYSMYEACQLCQGRLADTRTWGEWTTNCTANDKNNGKFPRDIPVGTAIPAWAYQYNYRDDQTFSTVEAQNYAASNNTEVVRSSTATNSANPSNPSNSGSSQPSKKSNAGAIAGGVVGGVVGLALIAGLVFFLLRRRKSHKAKSAPSSMHQSMAQEKYPPSQYQPSTNAGEYQAVPRNEMSHGTGQKLYNPSDPTTFPDNAYASGPTPAPTYHSRMDNLQPNRLQNHSGHPNVAEL